MFFKHKFVARKCACGEALGFKVAPMLQFISVRDVQIRGDVLRSFIRRKGIGCNGVKVRQGTFSANRFTGKARQWYVHVHERACCQKKA